MNTDFRFAYLNDLMIAAKWEAAGNAMAQETEANASAKFIF